MSFDSMKKEIAYAAITRHMHDNLYTGDAKSGFSDPLAYGDVYPATEGDQGDVTLVQPGDNAGSYERTFNPYQEIYKPWFDKIDDAFEHWDPDTDLCKPGEFEGLKGHLQDAVWRLTLAPEDKDNVGNAEIATSVGYIDKWIQPGTPGAFDGEVVRAFDDAYGAARIRLVTGNQRELMIVLGLALAGEAKMWTKVREDLETIMDGAKKAFEESGDAAKTLGVLTAIIGLAGSFATGGVGTALGVLGAAGGVVQSVLPPEEGAEGLEAEMEGSSAEDVYDNMVGVLDKLAEGARTTEEKLNTMLTQAADMAYRPSRRESFHINPGKGLDSDLTGAPALTINADLSVFRDIGYREMPEIAAEMFRSVNAAQVAHDLGPWIRNYTIGYGSFGPWQAWSDLYDVVTSVVDSSAAEIILAGEKLAQAAGYLEDSDGSAREALKGLEGDVKGAEDGWVIKDSTPPPPDPIPMPGGKVIPY